MAIKQYERVIAEEVWSKECNASERLVLLTIAHYQSKGYQPSAEDVSVLCGLSLNTVVRCRSNLVSLGHLKEIVVTR